MIFSFWSCIILKLYQLCNRRNGNRRNQTDWWNQFLYPGKLCFWLHESRSYSALQESCKHVATAAIEVDGVSFHDNELQRERDSKKNHILEILGLPLFRLSTDGHNEEARIIESLTGAMQLTE